MAKYNVTKKGVVGMVAALAAFSVFVFCDSGKKEQAAPVPAKAGSETVESVPSKNEIPEPAADAAAPEEGTAHNIKTAPSVEKAAPAQEPAKKVVPKPEPAAAREPAKEAASEPKPTVVREPTLSDSEAKAIRTELLDNKNQIDGKKGKSTKKGVDKNAEDFWDWQDGELEKKKK